MYQVIGRDGLEYGPVDADGLRRWILEGRVTAASRARVVGTDEWKTLGDFAEFAAALGQAAAPPSATPPTVGQAGGDALVDETLRHQPQVRIGSCISRGFDLVTNNAGVIVGGTVVAGLLMMVPIIGWLLSGPLMGGLCVLVLRRMRGRPTLVSDLFVGFGPLFWQLLLARVIAHVLISVGLMFCLAPGIYLAVAWAFAIPLIIDRNMEFWTAMEVSRRVVNRMWWPLFGLLILAYLIAASGLFLCLIGLVITAPIALASILYAYEDVFGSGPTTALAPVPAAQGASI
jgi:hypothetical protein